MSFSLHIYLPVFTLQKGKEPPNANDMSLTCLAKGWRRCWQNSSPGLTPSGGSAVSTSGQALVLPAWPLSGASKAFAKVRVARSGRIGVTCFATQSSSLRQHGHFPAPSAKAMRVRPPSPVVAPSPALYPRVVFSVLGHDILAYILFAFSYHREFTVIR